MMEKIDLRRKYAGEYPPDIAQLIAKHNGVIGAAETAAGIYHGHFGKIRAGKKPYTQFYKDRVLAALNQEGHPMPPNQHSLTVPEGCPPLLGDLIRFTGSKSQAWRTLGTSEGTFYKVITGRGEMPPEWIVRAKAAMGVPVLEPYAHEQAAQAPAQPQIPEFVPWDGKLVSVQIAGAPGEKPRTIKNVPQPIAKLIEKFGGKRATAAAATGHTAGWLQPFLDKPKEKFKERAQRTVHNALHGVAPDAPALNDDYDKYTLGQAIVMLKGSNFDRVQDIAEILNGRLVFKMNTALGWLLIYKMAADDLQRFKKLALRDAQKIVCP